MTTSATPWDAEIERLYYEGNTPKAQAVLDLVHRREGYLAAKAEPDPVKQALLAECEAALPVLHAYHPNQERLSVGVGICRWKPCQQFREAIARAKKETP